MLRAVTAATVFIGLVVSAFVAAMSSDGSGPVRGERAIGSAGAMLPASGESGQPAAVVEEARVPYPPRNVTPPGIYTGPVRRYEPAETPQPAELAPAIASRSFPRVVVEEAGVLSAGGTRIRLADITAPELDATCTDASGEEWPCGRRAMAALRLLLRNRAVECEIAEETADELVGGCRLGDRDIAAWLVEQGWAEPADGGRYQSELQAAREADRGMFEASRNAPPPVSVPVSDAAAD